MPKSNDERATLRSGKLPKREAVRTVAPDVNKKKAVERAEKQNNGNVRVGSNKVEDRIAAARANRV